jgi:hypothetical protein
MRRADIEVPNRGVDVNSRPRSACYPRSTFCPLSGGAATSTRRITRPRFRVCSACPPRSQAAFCPCARRAVADRAEATLGLLRYCFGGNRPSQTDPLALSRAPLQGTRLEPRPPEAGISLPPPPPPGGGHPRLPAMLRTGDQGTAPDYSEGSQGLSVLLRESGIFTGTTTSPRSSSRQRPYRYTIRAGRNLPDKEFRYLRTVIVTADIHGGFGSELRPKANTSP